LVVELLQMTGWDADQGAWPAIAWFSSHHSLWRAGLCAR